MMLGEDQAFWILSMILGEEDLTSFLTPSGDEGNERG
jgi:hypothetical protein